MAAATLRKGFILRLDSTHHRWLGFTIAVIVVSWLAYLVNGSGAPAGVHQGATWLGLVYGLGCALVVIFAVLLTIRKARIRRRWGPLTWWLKGHLWLGGLALPFALFHGDFQFGGPLTTILLWLVIITVTSGVAGVALQHFLPTTMMDRVPEESTYDQVKRSIVVLRRDAYMLVWETAGDPPDVDREREEVEAVIGVKMKPTPTHDPAPAGITKLTTFYAEQVVPFLRNPRSGQTQLNKPIGAHFAYEMLRLEVDPLLAEAVTRLEEICERARHKTRQVTLHRLLHGWLLVHMPLAFALLLLMSVHAFMALYY